MQKKNYSSPNYNGQSSLSYTYGHGHAMTTTPAGVNTTPRTQYDTKPAAAATAASASAPGYTSTSVSYPEDELSYKPPHSNTLGRNTLPSIGYGMTRSAYPTTSSRTNDNRAQRNERRTLVPSPLTTTTETSVATPPPPYHRKPPPSQPPPGTNPTRDITQTLATWTTQFNELFQEDDEEEDSLLTEHAQRTLWEIQQSRKQTTTAAVTKTERLSPSEPHNQLKQQQQQQQQMDDTVTTTASATAAASATANEIMESAGSGRQQPDTNLISHSNNSINGIVPTGSIPLPPLEEGRREFYTILSHKNNPHIDMLLHKPLEPNMTTTGITAQRLRKPPVSSHLSSSAAILYEPHTGTTTITKTVDVMVGVVDGTLTRLEQRIACTRCATPLVASKTAILVICPRCHCKFPNRREGREELSAAAAGGGGFLTATGAHTKVVGDDTKAASTTNAATGTSTTTMMARNTTEWSV
jgi:hypothetical protein